MSCQRSWHHLCFVIHFFVFRQVFQAIQPLMVVHTISGYCFWCCGLLLLVVFKDCRRWWCCGGGVGHLCLACALQLLVPTMPYFQAFQPTGCLSFSIIVRSQCGERHTYVLHAVCLAYKRHNHQVDPLGAGSNLAFLFGPKSVQHRPNSVCHGSVETLPEYSLETCVRSALNRPVIYIYIYIPITLF